MKYIVYAKRLLASFLFDARYMISMGIRQRISHHSYTGYRAMRMYADYLKTGAAMEGIRPLALRYCKGKGVDIGAGAWPLPGARGIDNGARENAYSIAEPGSSLDFVFSSHALEHLAEPHRALAEWTRVLAPGGFLVLYLPHPACGMWAPAHNPYHLWQPDPCELEDLLRAGGAFDIEYVTHLPDAMFSFALVARRRHGAGSMRIDTHGTA